MSYHNQIWLINLAFEQKLPWLKIDFDRIKHESESEGEPDANPDISAKDMLRTKVN